LNHTAMPHPSRRRVARRRSEPVLPRHLARWFFSPDNPEMLRIILQQRERDEAKIRTCQENIARIDAWIAAHPVENA